MHLLTKWGALLPQAQILWGAAFIGPFLWVVYYPVIHFSKPAIAFKEKGILRAGISSRYIVWKLVQGAKLIRYTDRNGGELVLNFRLNSAERIALPGKTDFDVVKMILQEKLGDKIAFSAQSAPVPTSFLRRLFPNRT
ncbi:hypothetical protein HPT27_04490 [Permianibacter sp. IMCC34836]|uniref:hypothetical protein n=1 Tax=Permianibacter fluminis TaxID=2738515 RepID=UPI0015544DAA|nr:hypothetical protein [Permianibacter fluminis]NQD36273.1 hypothetical protein [Permianibacter fluminis]